MGTRVLVCTIECWTLQNGANTFPKLFQNFPSEDLSNLYIREEIPDLECSSRYFQISEQRVIRSLFRRKIQTGREVCCRAASRQEDLEELAASRKLYNRNRKHRSSLKLLLREAIWALGRWRTPELDQFLNSVNPDVIVFEMSGYLHYNRICRYALEKTGAKGIGYFYDDNFTYRQAPGNWKSHIRRSMARRSLKKLSEKTSAFWAITEKTKREADACFGINCTVLTKPIDYPENSRFEPYVPGKPVRMLYTGNLLIGRWEVIQILSDVLRRINGGQPRIILDVYTNSYIPEEEISGLSKWVVMHGAVPQNQVAALQQKADVLLFAEAIDGPFSRFARLSFSTKLTDYMGSGKCILAIGAPDVAPMEYLRENEAAICACNKTEIYETLLRMSREPAWISQMAQQAYDCGKRNHSREHVSEVMNQTLQQVLS